MVESSIPGITLALIGIPLLMSPIAFLIGRLVSPRLSALFANGTVGSQLILLAVSWPRISSGGAVTDSFPWIPELGLTFSFKLDQLSYPFVLVTSIIGLVAGVYSLRYMRGHQRLEVYYSLYMMFVSGITGVFLATNLFIFYIFWELMLIPSYFLLLIWGTGDARVISFKYFALTHVGALSLLAGIIWLNALLGSVSYDVLLTASGQSRPELVLAAGLIFIGVAVKMAVVPFHSWLPDAYAEAPSPISAVMGGVMVNTGIYAFARILVGSLSDAFAVILPIPIILGLIAIYWGGAMALVQTDIKRVIAYSSVSQMGYVVFGFSVLHALGFSGAVFHAVTHGLAKAMLFLAAGSIIYSTKERDVNRLGGLTRSMPITSITFLVGALSIAGTPPLAGFFSEWLMFSGGFASGYTLYTIVAVAATALTLSYFLRAFTRAFLGSQRLSVSEPPVEMTVSTVTLVLLVILIGVLNSPVLSVINGAVPPNL
ncbi:MAG: NADH-quinone oxidoreductase subunit M [Aigarchaeota archaeon]|nr:NADH-quinone oxidoreductase subunit M [Aigarchaeota archaeon]MDW8092739.1 NADH-quinone oxidoreductase subunit M [Nitrososphaerota archaeon]